MPVTARESIQRHAAHQKFFQNTIFHNIYPTSFYTLIVIQVESIQLGSCITAQSRVAIHLEFCRKNQLSYFLLKSLATTFQTMSFNTVTENFMEKYSTSRTGQNSRTRVRINNRSITQHGQSLYHIFSVSNHSVVRRKIFRVIREI